MDTTAELFAKHWTYRPDFFDHERDYFERDLHIIIVGSFDAGMEQLAMEFTKDSAKLEADINKTTGDHQQWLVDSHAELMMDHAEQERFLRNMAFVALGTRLIHALRKMLRTAETFCPRNKKYRDTSMSEILRIWAEIGERFGIDLAANADKIAFAMPLNDVRNQIVHDGGDANPQLSFEKCTVGGGDESYLDLRFSKRYPEYVEGSGSLAAVRVTKEQFDRAFEASVVLVKWLAQELRIRQLAYVKSQSQTV
jgi:hypothetical protein